MIAWLTDRDGLADDTTHQSKSAVHYPQPPYLREHLPIPLRPMETTPVFGAYWRFAAERHAMFCRRLDGPRGPWTNDPILLRYRFTNTYRGERSREPIFDS